MTDLTDHPRTIAINLTDLERDLWNAGYSRDQIALVLWAINRASVAPK